MEIYRLNILFIISKSRINKAGLAPLFCRLTYLEKRKQFATGLFIKPDFWNNSKQIAQPPNEGNSFINSQLSLIKNNINQAFLFLQLQKQDFNVEQIYKQYAGETQNEDKTLMDALSYHNNRMKKLIGIEVAFTTWEKYHQTQIHLSDFIWYKYRKKDILLKELSSNFINEYEYYLKTEKKFMISTVFKCIQRLRRVIKMAIAMDYLTKDPFILYHAKEPHKEIVYLSVEELNRLESYPFASDRLSQVRDMFIFCCYTGLAYTEMANLKPENLIKHPDGSVCIEMCRQKTQRNFVVPLLKKAQSIIYKYENDNQLLPIITNQKFNAYLKEIADIVNINKRLTHHIARKTFATTILLYNDVPIEIVSELLGHSKISITQEHYAKVMQSKVNEHINRLEEKLR
jgi:site-specific recombinase XerD